MENGNILCCSSIDGSFVRNISAGLSESGQDFSIDKITNRIWAVNNNEDLKKETDEVYSLYIYKNYLQII